MEVLGNRGVMIMNKSEYNKKYYISNRNKIREQQNNYYKEKREEILSKNKDYRQVNLEKIKERSRRYYAENREKMIEKTKIYRINNPEQRKTYRKKNLNKLREYEKQYRESNLERTKEKNHKAFKKWHSNPRNKLSCRIANLIRWSLKKDKNGKHWEELVNYTLKDLAQHLEKQFKDGMNWSKFLNGEIHIDHKRPVSSFNFKSYEDKEFKECWALANLQPLWVTENLSKGAKFDRGQDEPR